MQLIILKYLSTAAIIVLVSEIAKRSDKLAALVAALPLVTILVLFWMYFENQPQVKIANYAWYTFWYVIPTLPMFLLFPFILPKIGFWYSIFSSIGLTLICFLVIIFIGKKIGLELI
tara:strand:+ start:244974 stop:245324 length:351 start_codon:yes stop_codon:yes gene_type:complete